VTTGFFSFGSTARRFIGNPLEFLLKIRANGHGFMVKRDANQIFITGPLSRKAVLSGGQLICLSSFLPALSRAESQNQTAPLPALKGNTCSALPAPHSL